MSTRNSDCSQLSQLKRDRVQAAYFYQQRTLQNIAQTGVFVPALNPQTGVYDSTRITYVDTGSQTEYYRAMPATIVNVPCFCTDATTPATMNENVPILQPVNQTSPQ
jgi:hypothetical protein